MQRVSGSHNSRHIATNVHDLCHKRFGQNFSTSSIRHVNDIYGEISVGSCDLVRVNTTLVSSEECVRGKHNILATFLRLYKSSTRSLASLYD